MRFPKKSGFKTRRVMDALPTQMEIVTLTKRYGFHSRETRSGRPSRCGWRWRGDARNRQAAAMRAAWAAGRFKGRRATPRLKPKAPVSAATKRRISQGVKRSWAGRDRARPMLNLQQAWQATRGSNGSGRCARGRFDHAAAKAWTIITPRGKKYHCRNLTEWARQNAGLFRRRRSGCIPTAAAVACGLRRAASGMTKGYRGFKARKL